MKIDIKDNKVKLAISCIVFGIILMLFGIIYELKNDKLEQAKEAIEHVFFYLPEENYDDLNQMPDYCKISLIYGTDYLKKDALLSKENYDTIVKRNGVKAYSKENIAKSIKNILGENATMNFELNEYEDYEFLIANSCKFGNKKINTLSYNETLGYIFSIPDEEKENSKLYVKWEKPKYEGDLVILNAKALLAIENADGGYDIFADQKLNYKAGSIKGSNIKSKIKDLYYKSMDHQITLKKENGQYIWVKYEVIDNIYRGDIIYD